MMLSRTILSTLLTATLSSVVATPSPGLPMAINTWGGAFTTSTSAAYLSLLSLSAQSNQSSSVVLDAVEAGCAACEDAQCDTTVGFGGSPDERCETTLDAMIMDGETLAVGAVAGLRRVKRAIGVARAIMEATTHTMLAGDLATHFALEMGFPEENLQTAESLRACEAWKKAGCIPNFRPGEEGCGPYHPHRPVLHARSQQEIMGKKNPGSFWSKKEHDTVSLIVIDREGRMAAGTSTNGASHKVPGRVGDGPIAGSGSYVDSEAGGCGATGDGDIMMRFLPCYQAVENLRRGMTPTEAAEDVVRRMMRRHPNLASGIVVVDKEGNHGAAASGWTFTYAFQGGDMGEVKVVTVAPVNETIMDKTM